MIVISTAPKQKDRKDHDLSTEQDYQQESMEPEQSSSKDQSLRKGPGPQNTAPQESKVKRNETKEIDKHKKGANSKPKQGTAEKTQTIVLHSTDKQEIKAMLKKVPLL